MGVGSRAVEGLVNTACRACGALLRETFADLGMTPMANAYIRPELADRAEPFYPLHAYVCSDCLLVQLSEFESPQEIFSDYAYFSSFSKSWLRHAEIYVERVTERFRLDAATPVVEVASNDGYLLQYFVARGIPVLGIDPARNVAEHARSRGVPTEVAFFGSETARRLKARGIAPKLMIANNVLAHVPQLRDFLEGFRILLAPDGVATFEFPHLLRLIEHNQFDTIYHEHFSYFSLNVVERIFGRHGLKIFDVEELPTHGGSLRIYARHALYEPLAETPAVGILRAAEQQAGLQGLEIYGRFARGVVSSKCSLLSFLIGARQRGERVVAYGAPAKGNTLLNYCGVGPEFVEFTVDRSPHKQGLLLPGTRIPIRAPEAIDEARPDYLLILPWNLREEIVEQMAQLRSWGGRFVVPIPQVEVF